MSISKPVYIRCVAKAKDTILVISTPANSLLPLRQSLESLLGSCPNDATRPKPIRPSATMMLLLSFYQLLIPFHLLVSLDQSFIHVPNRTTVSPSFPFRCLGPILF